MEALQKANTSLEEVRAEKNKEINLIFFLHQIHVQANVQYKDKEDELSALSRRIMLLETESNGADVKLAKTTMEVSIISPIYDNSFKYAINAESN